MTTSRKSRHDAHDGNDAALLTSFGIAVRDRRTGRGLSQHDLADAAGMDRKTVNRIENGRHAVDLPALVRLAGALRVAPATLLRAAQDSLPQQPARPVPASDG